MRFAYPELLLLLLVIPVLVWRYRSSSPGARIVYSDISRIKKMFGNPQRRAAKAYTYRHALFAIRILVLTLFIFALARPQAELRSGEVYTEGVDIVLTVDVSASMNLIDLDVQNRRTRMEVTKEAVQAFIAGRENDRIGMVVFATEAYLQCPLTLDYSIVRTFLDAITIGMISERQTAIGNALASSLNRLRVSEAESKVIILITDGANNAGQIDPFTAADIARLQDVRIYTIGVGGTGTPYIFRETLFGGQLVPYPEAERIDEPSLRRIAETTGGRFYQAVNTEKFIEIFEEIDQLEKTEIETQGHRHYRELFPWVLIPALFLLFSEVLLSQTRFRKLP